MTCDQHILTISGIATIDYVNCAINNALTSLISQITAVSGSLQSQIDECCPSNVCSGNHAVSLEMDGSTQYLGKSSDVNIGISNSWSISAWVNLNVLYNHFRFLRILPTSGAANAILLDYFGNSEPKILQVNTQNSAGSNIKVYKYEDFFASTGVWYHVVVSWDGSLLKVYRDGMEITPDTLEQDYSGSMTSTDRRISLGSTFGSAAASWSGKLYSYAMWSTALSEQEISEIYSAGCGVFDLSTNTPNYSSASALLHWWKLGEDVGDIGKDYGNHSTLIDVMDNASGISSSDLVNDFPGM